MAKKIYSLILTSCILFLLSACNKDVTIYRENKDEIKLIEEVIMSTEFSEDIINVYKIQENIDESELENRVYDVALKIKEDIVDEKNYYLELEKVLNSFPTTINSNVLIKYDIDLPKNLENSHTININEYTIILESSGTNYSINKHGFFENGNFFNPIEKQRSREKLEALYEETKNESSGTSFKNRRFDFRMTIVGAPFVFKNKTWDELEQEYRIIYVDRMSKKHGGSREYAAPPLEKSMVYVIKEHVVD